MVVKITSLGRGCSSLAYFWLVFCVCVFMKTFNVMGQVAFEDDSLTTNWWNVATTNYMLDLLSQSATSKLASSSFHF